MLNAEKAFCLFVFICEDKNSYFLRAGSDPDSLDNLLAVSQSVDHLQSHQEQMKDFIIRPWQEKREVLCMFLIYLNTVSWSTLLSRVLVSSVTISAGQATRGCQATLELWGQA